MPEYGGMPEIRALASTVMGLRLTGLNASLPWMSAQFERVPGDRRVAKQIIEFLEEQPVFCGQPADDYYVSSVEEIIDFLKAQIDAQPGNTLQAMLRPMRRAGDEFIDAAGPKARNFRRRWPPGETFDQALEDLKTSMAMRIAEIADKYKLDIDNVLALLLQPGTGLDKRTSSSRRALSRRPVLIGGLAAIAAAGAASAAAEQIMSDRPRSTRTPVASLAAQTRPVEVTAFRILSGQAGGVEAAFSPDAKILASGAGDGTIWLREVPTCDRVAILRVDSGVTALAFSPNGRFLASGHTDTRVRLWDVTTQSIRATFDGNRSWVTSVTFSPDSRTLASCSTYDTIRLWDVVTGQETSLPPDGQAYSVAFGPDGSMLATADYVRRQGQIV